MSYQFDHARDFIWIALIMARSRRCIWLFQCLRNESGQRRESGSHVTCSMRRVPSFQCQLFACWGLRTTIKEMHTHTTSPSLKTYVTVCERQCEDFDRTVSSSFVAEGSNWRGTILYYSTTSTLYVCAWGMRTTTVYCRTLEIKIERLFWII